MIVAHWDSSDERFLFIIHYKRHNMQGLSKGQGAHLKCEATMCDNIVLLPHDGDHAAGEHRSSRKARANQIKSR